jgi:predicted RNA binding protein YcfA (HicA-like mRNA interferase family)
MKSISGRDFARIIEQRGWTLLRVNGSLHIYGKQGQRRQAFRANPRKQAAQDRFAKAFDKTCQTFGRRSDVMFSVFAAS